MITGAEGFIARNLRLHLAERKDIEILCFSRGDLLADLSALVSDADFIFHLAGINRPKDPAEFNSGNIEFTQYLCDLIVSAQIATGKKIPILFTSSSQASHASPYGISKVEAEDVLLQASKDFGITTYIFRLPNVFGKWCKPNYNSVVATFCHNIARDLPIQINDPEALLTLVYIDDVVSHFISLMDKPRDRCITSGFYEIEPRYKVTLSELARILQSFKNSSNSLVTERVGVGLVRALYATYLSYLPVELFSYKVPQYQDSRGTFVEMLKTQDSGQISFFTAHPGITRGGHYHNTKNEKFLVIKGVATFKFRHMNTGQFYELTVDGKTPEIVETIPGWTHDITNIGSEELIVMLWANEIFDRAFPDTYSCPL